MANEEKDRWTLLAEAAVELNDVLGLEPPISVEEVSEVYLEEKIDEAARKLVRPDDEFTDQTQAVIDEFLEPEDSQGEEIVQDGESWDEEDEFEDDEDWDEDFEDEFEDDWDEEEPEEEPEEEEEEPEESIEEAVSLGEHRDEVENLSRRKYLRQYAQDNEDIFGPVIEKLPDLKSSKALKGAMLSHLDDITGGAPEPEPEDDWEDDDWEEEEESSSSKKEAKPKSEEDLGKPMAQIARETLVPLLEEGEHTHKELKEILMDNGVSKATASVILSDSKNPKYNSFDRLVVEHDGGKLKFEKE